MIGRKYGRLTVISDAGRNHRNKRVVLCRCDCENEVAVERSSLRTGNTSSCGCYKREVAREVNVTHGMTGTPLWNSWRAMKERCLNPKDVSYPNYGGRGIKVCEEWLSFENFMSWAVANGYREGLWIERIDNDGDYCPENCTWATRANQSNNRRNNHTLTFQGQTLTLAQWARKLGIGYSTLRARVYQGWSAEQALTTPVGAPTGPKPRLTATYRGETKSLAQWAVELGINYGALRARLKRGWDFETAINTPISRGD